MQNHNTVISLIFITETINNMINKDTWWLFLLFTHTEAQKCMDSFKNTFWPISCSLCNYIYKVIFHKEKLGSHVSLHCYNCTFYTFKRTPLLLDPKVYFVSTRSSFRSGHKKRIKMLKKSKENKMLLFRKEQLSLEEKTSHNFCSLRHAS